jgi:hypothetical protein
MEKNQIKRITFTSAAFFIFSLIISLDNINNYNTAFAQSTTNKVNLKIQDLSVARVPTGTTEILGKVINNSTSDVHNIAINMAFYDKKGTLLGSFDNPLTPTAFVLKPGESHPFHFSELVSFYRINTSNVTATGDTVKQ